MFKLHTYLKEKGHFHLIDSHIGEDREPLVELGQERRTNNPNYVVALVKYSADDVTLLV